MCLAQKLMPTSATDQVNRFLASKYKPQVVPFSCSAITVLVVKAIAPKMILHQLFEPLQYKLDCKMKTVEKMLGLLKHKT